MSNDQGWNWGKEDEPDREEIEDALKQVEHRGRTTRVRRAASGAVVVALAVLAIGAFGAQRVVTLNDNVASARHATTTIAAPTTTAAPDYSPKTIVAVDFENNVVTVDPSTGKGGKVLIAGGGISSVAVSKDGQSAYFTQLGTKGQCGSNLYRIPVAGGKPSLVVTNADLAMLNADGTKIAYVTDRCTNSQGVSVLTLATGKSMGVVAPKANIRLATTAWKGNDVGVTTEDETSNTRSRGITYFDTDSGKQAATLTPAKSTGDVYFTNASPVSDGTAIVEVSVTNVGGTSRIAKVDSSGAVKQTLASNVTRADAGDLKLFWASADGKHVIYQVAGVDGVGSLYRIDNGSKPVELPIQVVALAVR